VDVEDFDDEADILELFSRIRTDPAHGILLFQGGSGISFTGSQCPFASIFNPVNGKSVGLASHFSFCNTFLAVTKVVYWLPYGFRVGKAYASITYCLEGGPCAIGAGVFNIATPF
jgi:hypothetical protein